MAGEPRTVDPQRLRVALDRANLPVLVVVLHQLTGERRWLEPPYAPARGRGMDDNADGGLPEAVQQEIRDAAYDAVLAWAAGAPVVVPAPRGDRLVELLSVAQGEPVPPEYEPMMAELLGFTPTSTPTATPTSTPTSAPTPSAPVAAPAPDARAGTLRVAVIGAGVSGMLAALRLRELGADVVVLEKNDDVGGTWLENRYPGAGVDTPSHLYSVSFHDHHWSTYFGRRDEVEGYLRGFADAYDVRRLIRFRTQVLGARWDDERQEWTLDLSTAHPASDDGSDHGWDHGSDGGSGTRETLVADVVVSAVGQLNRPSIPTIPGRDAYGGTVVHSAQWPDGVDLAGKRVAIVGTGASAMQIVPAIVDEVAHLTVFQRSPQWVAPNADIFRRMHPDQHWLMDVVPFYRRWYRARLAWTFNDKVHRSLQVDPDWDAGGRSVNAENDGHRRAFTRYLMAELDGRPDLVDKCLPDYPPFGKRMLLDNGWFAALRRDHVDLVTEAVERFTPTGLQSASVTVDADVVILCTGFQAHAFLAPLQIRGRSGRTLAEHWGADDATAYLGITVPDYPNLFLLLGPNTALGHGGSMITIAELQVGYVTALVNRLQEKAIGAIEVRDDVAREYTRRVDDAHAAMIWTHPGMTNWYRNAAGRVVNTLPWRIVDYREMVLEPDPADFLETPRHAWTPSAPGGPGGARPSSSTSR